MLKIIIKGEKGTFTDTPMEAIIDEETNQLHLSKGFMGLIMSELQARKLGEMLNSYFKKLKAGVRKR